MPHCTQCRASFDFSDDDAAFLKRVSPVFSGKRYLIPPPKLCPRCRQQRRTAWRNERTLYYRPAAPNGKLIFSMYAPGAAHTIYERDRWYSDAWDGLQFGRDFDFSRPFFAQWHELHHAVPLLGIVHQAESNNCEYTNFTASNKDCYYIFCANDNEACLYSTYLQRNRDVADAFFVFDCERCYECIDCFRCYEVLYAQCCENCRDSAFLFDCHGCRRCIGCVSLAHKQLHLFNVPCSEEEYERARRELLASPQAVEEALCKVAALKRRIPQKYYAGLQNEEVSGDHVSYSKRVENSFDCTYLEDCKHCTWLHRSTHCYDCYAWGLTGELGYENHLCGYNFYNLQFCDSCWVEVSDLMYCRLCVQQCRHLFGCVGLRYQPYCVLNNQYTREQYEELVPRIIEHMLRTGEWGEFFPAALTPYAYNETLAHEYFPLEKREVLARGLRWSDHPPGASGKETVQWNRLPLRAHEAADSLTQSILACTHCSRNYRITQAELKLYRSLDLPLPRVCFDCRYQRRFACRNPRHLWERNCAKCGAIVASSYAPRSEQRVYCETCYREEVF